MLFTMWTLLGPITFATAATGTNHYSVLANLPKYFSAALQ